MVGGTKVENTKAGQRISLDSLCEKVARLKELAEERALQKRGAFVETSLFRRIEKFCRETLVMQCIGIIYGEPQTGKTEAFKEYARRNNHGNTVYVLTPASGGAQAMLKAIATACHISERTSFEQLRERVGKFLDGSKLLIMDEVHELFLSYQEGSMLKCLGLLRQLQERSKCGLVLCGTNAFRNELEAGEFAQNLKQLRMRGIWELQLEGVMHTSDMAAIAESYKLPAPDKESGELLNWIRGEGISKYTRFLARAGQLAAKRNQRFGWHHFRELVVVAEKMRRGEG